MAVQRLATDVVWHVVRTPRAPHRAAPAAGCPGVPRQQGVTDDPADCPQDEHEDLEELLGMELAKDDDDEVEDEPGKPWVWAQGLAAQPAPKRV